ncbi:transglycosylase SLT domain-containing protein [bacterium]|nr:transglycosylase SLT domain-containing protein [bacterium]
MSRTQDIKHAVARKLNGFFQAGLFRKIPWLATACVMIATSSLTYVAANSYWGRGDLSGLLSHVSGGIGNMFGKRSYAVLSHEDREYYRAAFKAASRGDFASAKASAALAVNNILSADVEAVALLHTEKPDDAAMQDWLARNPDHPMSERLAARMGIDIKAPRQAARNHYLTDEVATANPAKYSDAGRRLEYRYASLTSWDKRSGAEALWQRIHKKVRAGDMDDAETMLKMEEASPSLSNAERDVVRASLASGYFADGDDAKALDLAVKSIGSSGQKIPYAYWVAGIASWRMGHIDQAAIYFSELANIKKLSDWERASASFWASRAYTTLGNDDKADQYLRKAASLPQTFYGLLASHQLHLAQQREFADRFGMDISGLMHYTGVKRAIALTEVDETELAARELEVLAEQIPSTQHAMLLELAGDLSLPPVKLESRIAELRRAKAVSPLARFGWSNKPTQVDPFLLVALAHQESGLNPKAVSPSGAVGLMQLMPSTAQYVARRESIPFGGPADLMNPITNLRLGQAYISYLMEQNDIGNNLVFVTAAYNAGPGNFVRWQQRLSTIKDPLLYIESLPSRETRYYVKQVMTNYWIASLKQEKNPETLDALADGYWPSYQAHKPVSAVPLPKPETKSL